MRTITVSLPQEIEEFIELLVEKEIFPNKSEFLRTAVREFLLKHDCFFED